jgi:hypothetical protein
VVVSSMGIELAKEIIDWFRTHEYVAIWLEGIALVAIFWLDLNDRRERRREQERQHSETVEQLRISQQQTNAATEAALAAKESADISAALHRPLVGLSGVTLKSGRGTRNWDIAFGLKNYGTLPAVNVGFLANVFTDDVQRVQHTSRASIQIMPSSTFEAILRVDWGEPDVQAINDETKKIKIHVRIPYQTEDGRKFEFTSEVFLKQGVFSTDSSTTDIL